MKSISKDVVAFWLECLDKATRWALDFLVATNPVCLYPVDQVRRVGFNTPIIGMYFDDVNTVPLQAALGDDLLSEYREFFRSDQRVTDAMALIDTKTVLTDQEVLATWNKPVPEAFANQPVEHRIRMLTLEQKSHIRATMWHYAYTNTRTVKGFHSQTGFSVK